MKRASAPILLSVLPTVFNFCYVVRVVEQNFGCPTMRCELIGSLSVPSFEIDREKEKEREEHEGEDDRAFLSREKSIRDRDARPPFFPRSIDRRSSRDFSKSYSYSVWNALFDCKQRIAISWNKEEGGGEIFCRDARIIIELIGSNRS